VTEFHIGQPVRRVEDRRFLTGQGAYVGDADAKGILHAVFLRSPHPHADIVAVDTNAAAAVPGVHAVLVASDVENDGLGTIPCASRVTNRNGAPCPVPPRPLLATDRVRFVGEAIAMVVADSQQIARDASELIEVVYRTLPFNVDTARASAPDVPRLWPEVPENVCVDWEIGDRDAVEAAFQRAAHVTDIDLVNNRVVVASMEPRGAIGSYDPVDGKLTLHSTGQFVHLLRRQLAEAVFRVPLDRVRVIGTDVGGGFGMKNFLNPEYALVVWAARRLHRPVKWIEDRSEAFLADDQARDNVTTASLALDGDHRIAGLRIHTIANFGAFVSGSSPSLPTGANAAAATGVYAVPAAHLAVNAVLTNTGIVGSYRGVGRSEAIYVIERLLDKAADELGVDPADLRRMNLVPAAAMPYSTPFGFTFDSGDFPGTFDRAMKAADYDTFPERRRESEARGKRRGIGIGYYIDNTLGPNEEGADIRFMADGTVTLLVGTFSNGQGLETTFRQLVADQLGIAFDRIDFVQGDTDRIRVGGGHGGSRSTEMGGSALRLAADRVIEKGRRVAAHVFEAAVEDIEFLEGRFVVAGTDRALDIGEVAAIARDPARRPEEINDDGLDTHEEYMRRGAAWPNGCHVAEVEIDCDTGAVTLARYTVVDDFGVIVNPMIVTGMVRGGVAQGVGQALLEDSIFDRDTGQLVSGSFMDYALPRADDLPDISVGFHEVPCTTNPLGVKGCGEAGTVGAHPAVIIAVVDALSDLGIRHIECPATPERVWRALRSHGA
jgi:carbon-monoxide dehydrogenase large subunit